MNRIALKMLMGDRLKYFVLTRSESCIFTRWNPSGWEP